MKKTITLITSVMLAAAMLFTTGCEKKETGSEVTQDTIRIFAGFGAAEAGKSDAAFIEKLEEETGVKLEFVIPPSSSYAERLNILLASGDYTDVIGFNDLNQQAFTNAIDQEIIIPLNDYLKDAPAIMEHTYDFSWVAMRAGKDKEKIYGIPKSSLVRNDGYAVRADWLKKVGLEIPEDRGVSVELFTEMLKRFTEEDPDGNGKDDTFGIMLESGSNKNLLPIGLSAFDCHGWQEYDNDEYKYMNPVYSKTNTAYKDALAFTQMLYKKGYIDPASTSYTSQDKSDKFLRQNMIGVRRAFAGHLINYKNQLKMANPDAELEFFYLKNTNDEIVGTGTADANGGDTGFWGHWSITSAAKNPAQIVKIFDWMLSDDGWDYTMKGIEGVEYTMTDGKYARVDDKDSVKWRTNFVRRAGNIEYFANTFKLTEDERNEIEPLVQLGIDTVKPTIDKGYLPPASKEISYINYSKTMDEVVSKILIGNLGVSAYDDALNGWYKNGGEEYVKQMNDYITSFDK